MHRTHSVLVSIAIVALLLFAPSAWDAAVAARGAADFMTIEADLFEPDDLSSQASTLAPGVMQAHTFHVDGDEDWAKFQVIAGRRYTIYTSLLDFNVDTILEIYGSDATTLIDENDDGGADLWSRIVFTASETGFYFVKVLQYAGEGTGAYSLTLERAPGVYLDSDQDADALTYEASSGNWIRQVSNGTGGFVETAGSWAPGLSVLPASFNNDGLTDFFIFNTSTGAWSKMLNDGASGFTTQATGAWLTSWERHVMDLDGDGISDLFLYDPETGVWFKCIATPSGFDYEQGQWSPGWEIYPVKLNVDQLDDLFLINQETGQWYWVISDPLGFFEYPYSEYWILGWKIYPGDFNGDGLTDLFLYDSDAGQHYIAFTGDDGFTYTSGAGWVAGWTPWVIDLNADGLSDLFLFNKANGYWFQLLGDGEGVFTTIANGFWVPGWDLYPSDFNGDLRADLLLYDPTNGVWYTALNTAPGVFTYGSGNWEPGLQVVVRPPIR